MPRRPPAILHRQDVAAGPFRSSRWHEAAEVMRRPISVEALRSFVYLNCVHRLAHGRTDMQETIADTPHRCQGATRDARARLNAGATPHRSAT